MTNNRPTPAPKPMGEVILYQSEDGSTRIEVQLDGHTVWLPKKVMADLFQVICTGVPPLDCVAAEIA